jgi:hypothetical protein
MTAFTLHWQLSAIAGLSLLMIIFLRKLNAGRRRKVRDKIIGLRQFAEEVAKPSPTE